MSRLDDVVVVQENWRQGDWILLLEAEDSARFPERFRHLHVSWLLRPVLRKEMIPAVHRQPPPIGELVNRLNSVVRIF